MFVCSHTNVYACMSVHMLMVEVVTYMRADSMGGFGHSSIKDLTQEDWMVAGCSLL